MIFRRSLVPNPDPTHRSRRLLLLLLARARPSINRGSISRDLARSKSKSVIDRLLLLTLAVLPRDGQRRHTYTSGGLTDEGHLHALTTDAAAAAAEEERARSLTRSTYGDDGLGFAFRAAAAAFLGSGRALP